MSDCGNLKYIINKTIIIPKCCDECIFAEYRHSESDCWVDECGIGYNTYARPSEERCLPPGKYKLILKKVEDLSDA